MPRVWKSENFLIKKMNKLLLFRYVSVRPTLDLKILSERFEFIISRVSIHPSEHFDMPLAVVASIDQEIIGFLISKIEICK